jgi:hypothetical protein
MMEDKKKTEFRLHLIRRNTNSIETGKKKKGERREKQATKEGKKSRQDTV